MDIKFSNTSPMFAHDVVISTVFKTKKDEKGKIKKEAHSEMLFIDMTTRQVISRIVLPLSVLESLPGAITDSLKKVKQELKSKELPKKEKIESGSVNQNYFG